MRIRSISTAALFALVLFVLTALVAHAADGQTTIGSGADLFSVAVFDDIAEIETQAGATGNTAGVVDTGDILFKDGGSFDPRDTKSGSLFVSNDAAAFDTVLVTFKDTGGFAGQSTVTVDIENLSNAETLSIVLSLSLAGANQWQGVFQVIETDTAVGNQIFASSNQQIIEVTSPDSLILTLRADVRGPFVFGIPAAGSAAHTSSTVSFHGAIHDRESGLRTDSEGPDGDSDGVTSGEPLAAADGSSVDIDINLDLANETVAAVPGDDESDRASSSWGVVPFTDGFIFSFDKPGHAEGDHFWNIVARDRVGNETITDVDTIFTAGFPRLRFKVDDTDPGTPTGLAVTTPGTDQTPTFTWNAAPDANLARHQVRIDVGTFSTVESATTFTVATSPVTHTLDKFRFDDLSMELRMGSEAAFGYEAGERINSADFDIAMTINVGDSIVFPNDLTLSASKSTENHFLTIAELGIDVEISDFGAGSEFTITPTESGTFSITCSAHADSHGTATLFVEGEVLGALSPGTHTIEVRGIDKAGNIGPTAGLVFSVTAPLVPGVSGPALAGLAALLVGAFAWAARRRRRVITA